MIREAHRWDIKVGVYTVNRAEDLDRLRRFGVDLVFTNFPSAIRMALRDV
jgi:glycerophosphoryl diester phosphodiesterase